MANVNAVWGIDVGQCALKALRLQRSADGTLEVTHFDVIEHPKILSQSDADADELIRNALDKFLSRNEIGKERIALAVPGQSSFARFIKLPPVEPKRIPEIVRFEAVQQIPFDIDEVEWDYQTFVSPRSPDVEVGIFAMRKELVFKHLSKLRSAEIEPDVVQLAPLALYNMMVYDEQTAAQGATILIDVGAENTDLVISDGDRIWLRSIPVGGNNFTESLVKAFKLPFSKAENLKRTAATSKYARQIFVAMRPVFGDLVSEVQRSIGFYTSLHRDAVISRVLCLGNAFRLPGLQKYLEQNLQVETVRPNSFNKIKPSATVNAPAFSENVWSFGVAYGLCVQALSAAPINSNLLPFAIARQRNWQRKRPWFAAAAGLMVVGVAASVMAAVGDSRMVDESVAKANGLKGPLATHRNIQNQKNEQQKQRGDEIQNIQQIKQIIGDRDTVLQVMYLVQNALPNEWRGKALQATHRETNIPIDSIRWTPDVEQLIARPDIQQKYGLEIYMLESVNLEFFDRKPPPPTMPTPGGRSGVAGTFENVPRRGESGLFNDENAGGNTGRGNTGRDREESSDRPAAAGPQYFRVRVVGVSNLPDPPLSRELDNNFLGRIYQMKQDDLQLAENNQKLKRIELDLQELKKGLQEMATIDAPGYWPAPKPQVVENPSGGQPQVVQVPPQKVTRFNVVFDVKILPPVTEKSGN